VNAGDINAMGLIDEVWHYVIDVYRAQQGHNIMADAFRAIETELGTEVLDRTLALFVDLFPPIDVYTGRINISGYLKDQTNGVPNKVIALEEMVLLNLANNNPAFKPYRELFDDEELKLNSTYLEIIRKTETYLRSMPGFAPYRISLIDMLMAPIKASPDSLYGQLEYIRTHWADFIAGMIIRILGGIDLIKEERKKHFGGPGPTMVPRFTTIDFKEIERFSSDIDWMPSLVLIAKSVYVWLDQLTKKYGRQISRLDQIPDEELKMLSDWGFTGLWLIGIWERSQASKKIKQITGNPEAKASAYSIYDYSIAQELGSDEALQNLQERAWNYGIRLATDMVPNHMGIYSRWIVDHPERFIQMDHSPYPSYRFSGPDLSADGRVQIYIEDGYWDRSDAAVVFKRIDTTTGAVQYIYHGNDGTSMPWNDTAQLDLLKSEVREAIIRETIKVAGKFSIIRFDAAMTLAKKHFQRLWYPLPGYGGDIPTRSAGNVSNEEFQKLFPQEFWRELVDRVALEAPDTLLLAEAFWLMEGYFVRSLGMHRVYNSAFMNMLKAEENSKYRDVMRNVLRFNPEILKRFVNFMNNPDEEPAVVQFGKGDKYFGVATLMVTMPGLPMFGHGQLEGFSEKYGMEYARAYFDENIDQHLVSRHKQQIFPLLRMRRLFSGVENFVLYDFISPEGHVNQDVFAYSNRFNEEKVLVAYNNRYAHARGSIRQSVVISISDAGKRKLVHKGLTEGLDIGGEDSVYIIFSDFVSGLEYIRSARDLSENGLHLDLNAYQSCVFIYFRKVKDDDEQCCRRLVERLNGNGVPNIMAAIKELKHERLLMPFGELINVGTLRSIIKTPRKQPGLFEEYNQKIKLVLTEIQRANNIRGDEQPIISRLNRQLKAILQLETLRDQKFADDSGRALNYLYSEIPPGIPDDLSFWRIVYIWNAVHYLGAVAGERNIAGQSRAWIDEFMLGSEIEKALYSMGCSEGTARRELDLIRILTSHQGWDDSIETNQVFDTFHEMLSDHDVRTFIDVNFYEGTWWFNYESILQLIYWLCVISMIKKLAEKDLDISNTAEHVIELYFMARRLQNIIEKSAYKVETLGTLLEAPGDL
ncbi:MAG: alpha-amylase, partial [Deltaproteobacteria bacterium]|nr:alpha-amylase [Deltaproteobacteria bacterium]